MRNNLNYGICQLNSKTMATIRKPLTIVTSLVLSIVPISTYAAEFWTAKGNTNWLAQTSSKPHKRILFRLPSRRAPLATVGGATRGSCKETPPIAILPKTNLGLTIKENPDLFVYIPENSAAKAELIITDSDNNEIYYTSLPKPVEEGILRIRLPKNLDLQVREQYKWRFILICEPEDYSSQVAAQGWIEKVEPSNNLSRNLDKLQPTERLSLYAEEGIWHETLATLANLRLENPEDLFLNQQWTDLLESMGLDSIARIPFLPYQISVFNGQ